jgi:hypothetical protein
MVILLAISMLDEAFPRNSRGEHDLHVGILEGEHWLIEPWLIRVHVTGALQRRFGNVVVMVELRPEPIIDQIDHGGTVDAGEYALGIFSGVVDQLAQYDSHPTRLYKQVRKNMAQFMLRQGITPEILKGASANGIILPPN